MHRREVILYEVNVRVDVSYAAREGMALAVRVRTCIFSKDSSGHSHRLSHGYRRILRRDDVQRRHAGGQLQKVRIPGIRWWQVGRPREYYEFQSWETYWSRSNSYSCCCALREAKHTRKTSLSPPGRSG